MKIYEIFVIYKLIIHATKYANYDLHINKPNIIILLCDDLGIYGSLTIHTSRINEMATNGAKLTQFYSGSPICSASRYSLLTGKYPIRSGFAPILFPNSEKGINANETTIAEVLKNVGYVTSCIFDASYSSTS